MKLLILTSEPITADQLRAALPDDVDPAQAELAVIAPALQDSPLKFWTSDADQAIARARTVRDATAAELDRTGATVRADTGESDPMQAIQDTLATFPADGVLIFSRTGDDGRYREDVDPAAVQERFGLPSRRVELSD